MWIWKWLYYKNYNVHIQGGVFLNGNGPLAGEQAMSEERLPKSLSVGTVSRKWP